MKAWAGLSAAAIWLIVLMSARSARAESVLVLLGGPAEGSDALSELLVRIRGELAADGFRVQTAGPAVGGDRARVVRETGRSADGPVAVGLFVDDDSGALDIVLVDTVSGRLGVKHVDGAQGEAPEVVARHAVDALRASLLDFALAGLRLATSEGASPRPAGTHPGAESDAAAPRWALEGGVGAMAGFAGGGWSVAPVLRLRFAATRELQLRVTGAGMGSRPSVQTDFGSATVQQGVLLGEATAVLWHSPWLRPLVTLGAGLYYVGVTGTGIPPYEGLSGHGIALALEGGAGLATSLTRTADLTLEAQVVLAQPAIAVRFVGDDAARMGQPALLFTLTLADWI